MHLRSALAAFGREYQARGLAVVALNANSARRLPADAPAQMPAEKASAGYTFPYLHDATRPPPAPSAPPAPPTLPLWPRRTLVYRGQFDASRPGSNEPITGQDLRAACDAALAERGSERRAVAEPGLQHQVEAGERADDEPGRVTVR
ncbi:MAG: thioredoxin family protein [bacterium]